MARTSCLILCMAAISSVAAAQVGRGAAASSEDTWTREVNNYRLTLPKIESMARVMRGLKELGGEAETTQEHEEQSNTDQDSDTASTGNWMAELEAQAEQDPKLKAVFTKAGINPREYYHALGAWMAADPHFTGGETIQNPTPAQRANRDLIHAHQAEFGSLFAQFSAMNTKE
jgi:hypothetical protein